MRKFRKFKGRGKRSFHRGFRARRKGKQRRVRGSLSSVARGGIRM